MSQVPRSRPSPLWQPAQRCHWQLPRALRTWLLDQGSLTAKLQRASAGQFRVQVLHQQIQAPSSAELRRLGLRQRQRALIREVVLYGRGQPWVFARSLLPLASLRGPLRRLRRLDNRPLGAFLFSQPSLVRSPLEVAALSAGQHYVPAALTGGETLWGRRSVFAVEHKPLLVSEVFLPAFVAYLLQESHRP